MEGENEKEHVSCRGENQETYDTPGRELPVIIIIA